MSEETTNNNSTATGLAEFTRLAPIPPSLLPFPEETTSSNSEGLAEEASLLPFPEETASSFAGLVEETTRLSSIRLASVPEETVSSFARLVASYPPPQSYRESIRSVAWPEWRIRSVLSSQSGQSGSSYSSISGASSSYMSGYSVGSVSAGTADFGTDELTKIAHGMVSDGYTQRMVQAFKSNGEQDGSLKTWFTELDIEWVFQLSEHYGSWQQPLLHGMSAAGLQEYAQRWIRALTIIIVSIKELVAGVQDTLLVARFGKASVSAMLIFIDAIVSVSNKEKLPAALQAYICVSNASYDMSTMHVISSDAQRILNGVGGLLERKVNKLVGSMSNVMRDVKDEVMKDNVECCKGDRVWWATEITRGGGEVHKNTRLMVDYVVLMRKTHASTQNSAQSDNSGTLCHLIDDTISYLKDLLLRISKLCSDPSLRYLFLLNNSHFVVQGMSEPSISLDVELSSRHHQGLELTPECANYMDSYIKVSWQDVMSCLSSPNSHGPLGRWINTSPLAKFQSAFHSAYKAQKFSKVPDPQLRSLLRKTITKRVISGYRDYLKEHPELEKQIRSGNSSPEDLEEMLGELFEG